MYLEVVHHGDVRGCAVVGDGVSLGSGDPAGGQDLVVLVHAQRLPTKVLQGQGIARTQTLVLSRGHVWHQCRTTRSGVFMSMFLVVKHTCQSSF